MHAHPGRRTAMPVEPATPLWERVRASGLLTDEQLAFLKGLPETRDPDPRALGRALLQRGWLTRLQVTPLAEGKARALRIGPSLLLDGLGEGGYGQVSKARHTTMDRVVALKLLRKDRLDSQQAVQRF